MKNLLRRSKLPYVFCWFLLIILLTIAFQSPLVQAQDSGGQTFATYELLVESPRLDRFCIGQNTPVVVKVRAHPLVTGNPAAGQVIVRNATITASPQDASIATAEVVTAAQGAAQDVPFESYLRIRGVSAGRTSVEVEVIGANTNRFGAASSFILRKTIPVQVVPCQYKITANSVWWVPLHKANALMSVNLPITYLVSTTGISFNLTAASTIPPLTWNTTVNRFRGCLAGHHTTGANAPTITGSIAGDEFLLKIDYLPMPPSTNFYLDLCPSLPIVDADCRNYPDRTCPVFEDPPRLYEPAPIEGLNFPLKGGVKTISHTLNIMGGSANGFTTITVTPVTP